jgi:hypothetical protein
VWRPRVEYAWSAFEGRFDETQDVQSCRVVDAQAPGRKAAPHDHAAQAIVAEIEDRRAANSCDSRKFVAQVLRGSLP